MVSYILLLLLFVFYLLHFYLLLELLDMFRVIFIDTKRWFQNIIDAGRLQNGVFKMIFYKNVYKCAWKK